jgi:hypothetical protein
MEEFEVLTLTCRYGYSVKRHGPGFPRPAAASMVRTILAIHGDGISRGFRPEGGRRVEPSGQRIGGADRGIVSSLTAAGVEEQVVELPASQGGVGVFGGEPIAADRAGGAGVDQQAEQRRHGLGRQTGNATADLRCRTRPGQGVGQRGRPWIVQHDPSGGMLTLNDIPFPAHLFKDEIELVVEKK